MQKSCYILCLLLLVSSLADAQDRRRRPPRPRLPFPSSTELPKSGWIISSNVFSFIETDAGPSLAIEYRPSLNWGVALEGTALLYTGIPIVRYNGTGFRIQPELRYYFSGRKRSFRGFFSLQGIYKQKTYQDSAFVRRNDPVTGNPLPQNERVHYEVRKQVSGGAVNIGFQDRFGKAQRFMLEVYVGLGLKYKDFKRDGRPSPIVMEFKEWVLLPDLDESGIYPHIPMGIRMGYRF